MNSDELINFQARMERPQTDIREVRQDAPSVDVGNRLSQASQSIHEAVVWLDEIIGKTLRVERAA